MNDRIKQIAEQATSYKEGLIKGKYDIEVFDKEMFAELLIRESARIADMVSENKTEWVGGNILTYFGVQE